MIANGIGAFTIILAIGALMMSYPVTTEQYKWAGISALFLIAAAICFK